jgi:hypothetical protein
MLLAIEYLYGVAVVHTALGVHLVGVSERVNDDYFNSTPFSCLHFAMMICHTHIHKR